MLAGETPGCSVRAKFDVAFVALHREAELGTDGWSASSDPTAVDLAVAKWALAVQSTPTLVLGLDRFPQSMYAVSTGDMLSGKLYWLEGPPLALHQCAGWHDVQIR